jgi:hypothetical protein
MAKGRKNKHDTTLKQVCELIPPYLPARLAKAHGVNSRSISPWSHVVALVFGQLAHSLGLNDVCDALKNHLGHLFGVRRAKPPSRNGLSHANKKRSAKMAEDLFWQTMSHLEKSNSKFGRRGYSRYPRRFRRTVHAIDSSTISLVANCIDWAKHRRRKAAAKLHLRLNLRTYLPAFAIVDTAKHNDNLRARELCAGLRAGEIAVFDKAYVDFEHLYDLHLREVFWVVREKANLKLRCVKRLLKKPQGKILADELVVPSTEDSKAKYPERLRRVRALVEIEGQEVEMTFLTNNLKWAASSVADLYQSRWGIEAFFKQLKQTLQLQGFFGHSRNAIQWQVWTALLTYVLLRYLAVLNSWPHSFKRLYTVVRGVLWSQLDLHKLLQSYGTARDATGVAPPRIQPFLPGLEPYSDPAMGQHATT